MERDSWSPSPDNSEEFGAKRSVGCGGYWGCFNMKAPINYIWKKSKSCIKLARKNTSVAAANLCATHQPKKPKFHGGFRYDPLSYAQNFDEGVIEFDDLDGYAHGFSTRFAALPASKSTGQYY